MAQAEVGKQAPQIEGAAFWYKREGGEELKFDLNDYKGQKLVLAFYPGDFTPVCTKEMCDFADNISVLKDLNALVVGISVDDMQSHRTFAKKYNLTFPLVVDSDKQIGKAYNVIGPLLGSRHRRAIFILDENLQVVFKKIEATAIFRTEAKEIASVLQKL